MAKLCLYCTPHPHSPITLTNNRTQTKATASTSTPSSMGTKSRRTRGGAGTKVNGDPGPLRSFVQKNGEVQEQLLRLHGTFETAPFTTNTKSGAVNQLQQQGRPEERGGAGRGGRGGVKVKEETFKVNVSHINQDTKETRSSAIWSRLVSCSGNHSQRSSREQLYPETAPRRPVIGCRGVITLLH
ncbi:unnamed protein product [Pleuronectes platessa]|uniref:Uncharacterized protein n=1 Tax=Pleuronectes platessa TaxID=8262 RepID=A0A9N7VTM2_PLEPL|nr:unnamed protein product [Pleuronectes platessa]